MLPSIKFQMDDSFCDGERVNCVLQRADVLSIWKAGMVLVLVLNGTVRFKDSLIRNSERIGDRKKTSRLKILVSNVSKVSNRAHITTWRGAGLSLKARSCRMASNDTVGN